MKKVIIISTSLRKNSNSDRIAKAFGKGAEEAGNDVEYISLIGKKSVFVQGVFHARKRKSALLRMTQMK